VATLGKEAGVNGWMVLGLVGVASSEKGRKLVREGVVHALATAISIGESAYGLAQEAASEAGGAAVSVVHTASRGSGAVTGVVGEAKARAHKSEEEAASAARKRKVS
jgi:hypothetical protein